MAKKYKKETKEDDKKNDSDGILSQLSDETKQAVFGIIFFVLAVLSILASFHKSGMVGNKIYDISARLLGVGYFLIPLLFLLLGISFLRAKKRELNWLKISGIIIFFISGLGAIGVIWTKKGGVIGNVISSPLIKLFDFYTSIIILIALLAISSLVIFETKLNADSFASLIKLFRKKDAGEDNNEEVKIINGNDDGKTEDAREKEKENEDKMEKKSKSKTDKTKEKEEDGEFSIKTKRIAYGKSYAPPPLSLLDRDSGKPEVGDIKANANIIKRTLLKFGIDVEMDEISIGPSVTRYSLKPAEGIKVSRIVALQNDLALALAAHPIRIEAPIPGKSLVGIEIPNSVKTTVGLGTILASDEYQLSGKPLLVSLGKSIPGKCYFGNMEKMPHLLIAGATGSGKSVTIHSIITSLLFRNSPEHMKFMMIDPKRVELTLYNKIPHLLTPVITDPKKAILALKWAAKEMDRRYDILEAEKVRDIESYHQNILGSGKIVNDKKDGNGEEETIETMPYIIIVIDELADIMQSYPRELESAIVRLAQMSRAVGIHLILSTQRPSVNVITGLIKANIPARIALQVASQIDSRTILDTGGAEKLLGAGDMLYIGAEMSKPVRLQSPFISETEVKKVVKYLTDAYKNEIPSGINFTENNEKNIAFDAMFENESMEDEDELYEKAKEEVLKAGRGSTSYLQRRLGVGYSRAAKLIDILEEKGVIGPPNGSKPREVIGGKDNAEQLAKIGGDLPDNNPI
ncbi:MAG: translocase FtsK protein [Parcubacteria group bacterium GW2011_GWA1_40_21]|nr:MAG: translocase FtsK protein [Parcubacteria group bacterium GW2011_GWC1_40_13]KKR53830.1 MAG: translocase FtsK protein [Parcubacteria group bacterium GW2011_GWA1_40_21]